MRVAAAMFVGIVLLVLKSAILDVFGSLVDGVQSVHRVLDSHAGIVLSGLQLSVQLQLAAVVTHRGKHFCTNVNVATVPDGSDESDDSNVSRTVFLIYKGC